MLSENRDPLLAEIAKLRAEVEDLRGQLAATKIDSDPEAIRVLCRRLDITGRQSQHLLRLVKRPGMTITHDQLAQNTSLRVHISRMRLKLRGTGIEIETVRDQGYRTSKESAAIVQRLLDEGAPEIAFIPRIVRCVGRASGERRRVG